MANTKEVGNALNSILSYMTRGKTIDVFGEAGINVFADEAGTQFRNFMDVFDDISKNWNNLSKDIQDGFIASADEAQLFNEDLAETVGLEKEWSDVQKRDVSNAAAGVYRRNYFLALIENFGKTKKVMEDLNGAQGYTLGEMDKNLDKISTKWKQFIDIIQQRIVNFGNDGATGGIKALLDGMIWSAENLGKVLTILSGIVIAFSSKALAGMITGLIGAIRNLATMTTVVNGARVAMTGLQASLGVIGLVLAGVSIAMIAFADNTEAANAAIVQNIQKTNDEVKSVEDLTKQYWDLNEQYKDTIAKGEDVTGIKEDIFKVVDQLNKIYPEYIEKIDSESMAYDYQISKVSQLNAEKRKQMEIDAKLFLNDNRIKIIEAKRKEQVIKNVMNAYGSGKLKSPYNEKGQITDEYNYLSAAYGEVFPLSGALGGAANKTPDWMVSQLNKELKQIQPFIESAEQNEKLIEALKAKDLNDFDEKSNLKKYGGTQDVPESSPGYPGKGKPDKGSPYRSEFNTPDKFLQQDKYKDLNDAIDGVNEALRENQAIMENTPEKEQIALLEKRIQLEEDLKTALHNKAEAVRQERSDIEKELTNNKLGLKFSGEGDDRKITNATWAVKSLGNWVDELRESKDKEAYTIRSEYAKSIIDKIERYNVGSGKDINSAQYDWLGALKGQNDSKSKIQDTKDDAFSKMLDSYGKSADKLDNELTVLEGTMSELGNDDLIKKLDIQNQLISKGEQVVKAYEEELNNLNFLTPESEKQTEEWNKKVQAIKDSLASATKTLSGYRKEIKSTNKDIEEQAKDAIASYVNYLKDQTNDRIDAIDKEKETYIDAKNAEIDAIEKKIDALDKENDAIDEQIQKAELLDKLTKAKEKVANVEKEKNVRIFQDGKFQWSVNPNDLREANDELAEVQKDYTEWDRENTLKHKKQTLQDEIDGKQELIRTKELWAKTEQDKLKLQLTQLDEITKKSNDNQITSYEQLMTTLEKLGVKAESELGRVKAAQAALGGMGVIVSSGGGGGGSGSSGGGSSAPAAYSPYVSSSSYQSGTTYMGDVSGGASSSSLRALMGFDTGGEFKSGTMGVNLSGKPERVLSPSQTQNFELLVSQLPQITSVFDRIFSGSVPTIPNFNRGGNSSMSNDNSVNINTVNVQANDAQSFVKQLKNYVNSY